MKLIKRILNKNIKKKSDVRQDWEELKISTKITQEMRINFG